MTQFRSAPEGQLQRAYYEALDPAHTGDGYYVDDNFGSWQDGGHVARGYDALGNRRGWGKQKGSALESRQEKVDVRAVV